MHIEIERRYLVKKIPLNILSSISIKQYYIFISDSFVQRIRFFNNKKCILSIKQVTADISKYEFEYEIPIEDGYKMIEISKNAPCIDKIRHRIREGNFIWEVDEFLADNRGLIIAEIELSSTDQKFNKPEWLDKEISDRPEYFNFNLANNPYVRW